MTQAVYPERSLYYASRLYGDQLRKGEGYAELEPLVCIPILVFDFFEDDYAFNSFKLIN